MSKLDFSEEINTLKHSKNEDVLNISGIIDSVVQKISATIKYNPLGGVSEIPEDDPIIFNELHHIFLCVSQVYKTLKYKSNVILKVARELFLSKLVEDENDNFYDEIMSSSHILSLELIERICIILRLNLVLIFNYNDTPYLDFESVPKKTEGSTNANVCIIHYKMENGEFIMDNHNNDLQHIESYNNSIEVPNSSFLKSLFIYYKIHKIEKILPNILDESDYKSKIVNIIDTAMNQDD